MDVEGDEMWKKTWSHGGMKARREADGKAYTGAESAEDIKGVILCLLAAPQPHPSSDHLHKPLLLQASAPSAVRYQITSFSYRTLP